MHLINRSYLTLSRHLTDDTAKILCISYQSTAYILPDYHDYAANSKFLQFFHIGLIIYHNVSREYLLIMKYSKEVFVHICLVHNCSFRPWHGKKVKIWWLILFLVCIGINMKTCIFIKMPKLRMFHLQTATNWKGTLEMACSTCIHIYCLRLASSKYETLAVKCNC